MNYIGNDIISLKYKQNLQSFSNPKYITKVLNKSETIHVKGINLSFLLPLCWSVKESAYKVFIKTGNNIAFSPRMFNINRIDILKLIQIENTLKERIIIPGIKLTAYGIDFYTFSEITREYIHSVSSLKKDDLEKTKRKVKAIKVGSNKSEEA